MLAADGTPLKQSLARSLRQAESSGRCCWLLRFFSLSCFHSSFPLHRCCSGPLKTVSCPTRFHLTVEALNNWDEQSQVSLPGEAMYTRPFVRDMIVAIDNKEHTRLGSRLNYEETGMSSMFRRSGRQIKKLDPETDGPFQGQS